VVFSRNTALCILGCALPGYETKYSWRQNSMSWKSAGIHLEYYMVPNSEDHNLNSHHCENLKTNRRSL
jgi:hypothetical protein